jgi:asparagine synthase (glutamine-hydrolysing)
MRDTLKRRGPDGDGLISDGACVLGHTRLCVVDIENGAQPMRLEFKGRRYSLVYNGELYNTGELRADLTARGHGFIGHSDTEVLLHMFAEYGADCVKKLNGIFAFAVWEGVGKRLFIARDRIGVKPFFYALKNGRFIFASEIKALLAHPDMSAEADGQTLAEILFLGPGRTPGCGVFRGVSELKPACCGRFDRRGLRVGKYWSLCDAPHTDNFEDTARRVRELVVDSIERQLVSDVPVGTFLSGGLDSGIISSVAARYFARRGQKFKTFSVDYSGNDRYFKAGKFQPSADSEYIEIMNRYLGAENVRVTLGTDGLVNALYAAVDARDLPGMADVDASLLLFCGEIKKHVTVALSGECADELFGGYPWYRDREIRERDGFPWAQSTAYRAEFLRYEFAARAGDAAEYVYGRYRRTVEATSALAGAGADERRQREMTGLNCDWFMQTLLDRKDRMSMYNGLEVRVPFCDYRIAEYLYSVPWKFKDWRGREKGLLREAMKDFLPPSL